MQNSTKRFRFTKASLLAIEPNQKPAQVYDTEVKGLMLLIYPAGSKTFFRQGRVEGAVRRVKIGAFPDVTVDQARKECQAMNGKQAMGEPLQASTRGGSTFGDLWQQYLDEHATIKKAESSRKHDLWQWKKLLKPTWEHRKASTIKKATVLELQRTVARNNGKVTANRVLSLVKKIFQHAIDNERLKENPAAGVKKFEERSRERHLQPNEIRRFFEALDAFDNPDMADFWRMCLFTGARQTNVLQMRWREIDEDSRIWTIPKTKAGRAQQVPLVDQALEIIKRRRNLSDYVFASHGKTGHLTRPGKAWDRLLEQAGIEDLTMHDLRRSLGSWQAAAGVSELVIGKTLGHSPGSKATSVYARLNLDPVRDAMSNAVAAMVNAGAQETEGRENA